VVRDGDLSLSAGVADGQGGPAALGVAAG